MLTITRFGLCCVAALIGQAAYANIVNGGFEEGLDGWAVETRGMALAVEPVEGPVSVNSGELIPASPSNDHFVFSSQTGPGATFLSQAFTVEEGTNKIFFDLYVRNFASGYVTLDSFDFTGGNNQQARVDIMRLGAAIDSLDPADIVATGFQIQPGDPLIQPWQTFEVDVTEQLAPYVGEEVVFRFAQVDNMNFFNFAIDNVNVGASQIPGPQPPVINVERQNLPLLFGPGQHFTLIDVSAEAGQSLTHVFTDIELAENLELVDVYRLAPACQIEAGADEQSVVCELDTMDAWDCVVESNTAYCYLPELPANALASLVVHAAGEAFGDAALAVAVSQAFEVRSAAQSGCMIEPEGLQLVMANQVTSFAVAALSGAMVESVEGCPGEFDGQVFTTAPVVEDCEVLVSCSFEAAVSDGVDGNPAE